ncbi:tyrosine--tRNA ligase [Candidatus Pacebacteria bacterium]|nr:tyrosine--tRNA ligase [Candidatus Paceibacterota bacterium]
MSLAKELQERGFVYQFSSETLEEIFDGGETRTVYLGIDPTADSMHVGHLVPYMMLNHIMNAGHHVIALMGGGTALIGDPSFKENERDIASVETIADQCKGLEANVRKITTSDKIEFVNNHDWLSELGAIEFMREVGKHFTINSMIKKESVSARLESENGISYTEFSYALLQSYDFYHLHIEKNCDVQIGGSDQWGNVTSGIDFVRRKTGDKVFGLTMPLIIDAATGKKFGKSEGNAVWLDADKTSPYTFYQFWLNTSDESVISYLKLFTFLSLEEISVIEQEHSANPGKREAQKKLAEEITTFVHGKETMLLVQEVTDILFGEGKLTDISVSGKKVLLENAPVVHIQIGVLVVDTLVVSGLASSKREARTFIESGAVTINGVKIENIEEVLSSEFFTADIALLKRGKKNLSVLVVQ